uniref:Uncharacterized protein n=1 Tax=Anopheles epiroticus TaxID=199890 RepID=A0A182P1M8_9DIPT
MIPGVVRKAAVAKQKEPVGKVNDTRQLNVQNTQKGIIPGSVRPVASKKCLNKCPAAVAALAPATKILRETRLGKVRAEEHGSTAWRPCPLRKTNKRFLNRTVLSIVKHNHREKQKTSHRSKLKLTELVRKANETSRERSRKPSKSKHHESHTNTDESHPTVIDLAEDSD